jgi:UDP-perosamine 4-acetyltransferase
MVMKNRVVILGGGGHAAVCAEILRSHGNVELVGYTDPVERPNFELQYLGDDSELSNLIGGTANCVFVALGSNHKRGEKIDHIRDLGMRLISAISPAAIILPNVEIGEGVAIMPGAVVNARAKVGTGVVINTGATVDHDCVLGSCSHVGPGVNLARSVEVGEWAFLGVGSCAIPGVKIGKSATVGAGAAVTSDIPDFATAVGVPARVIKVDEAIGAQT